jgi:hypothetical protein
VFLLAQPVYVKGNSLGNITERSATVSLIGQVVKAKSCE